MATVIVGHNSERWLRDCLRTLIEQMPPTALVVYVDNASTDSSREIAHCFPSVISIRKSRNRGFGAGCNIGATAAGAAGADYLFFLNPDTRAHWPAIAECAALLELHPEVGVVGPLQLTLDGASTSSLYNAWTRRIVRWTDTDVLTNRALEPLSDVAFENWLRSAPRFIETAYVNGAALCIRAETFFELGGFDERYFLFFEEVALCREARERGYRVGLCTAASIRHAWGGHATGVRSLMWARSKYLYLLTDPVAPRLHRLRAFANELVRDLRRGRVGWKQALVGFRTLARSSAVLWDPSRRLFKVQDVGADR
jgi:GT2 family glycosyltransferase